jgi:hypothetical protein
VEYLTPTRDPMVHRIVLENLKIKSRLSMKDNIEFYLKVALWEGVTAFIGHGAGASSEFS